MLSHDVDYKTKSPRGSADSSMDHRSQLRKHQPREFQPSRKRWDIHLLDGIKDTHSISISFQLSWRVKQTGRPTSSTGRTSGCLTTICPLLNWVTDSLNSFGTYTSWLSTTSRSK